MGGPGAGPPAGGTRLTGHRGPSAGLLLPAIFSVCLAYVGSSTPSTMAFLVLASSAQSFCLVGVLLNPLDIAPR